MVNVLMMEWIIVNYNLKIHVLHVILDINIKLINNFYHSINNIMI